MPLCCILQCGLRKNKNNPQLTHHRFPKNEGLRRKWLAAIGEENINPRHKDRYLCSVHFEEACFNKTLNVARLRDDSIPTIFPISTKKLRDLCEMGNVMTDAIASTSASSSLLPPMPHQHNMGELQDEISANKSIDLREMGNVMTDAIASTSAGSSLLPPMLQHRLNMEEDDIVLVVCDPHKVKPLEEKCAQYKKTVKALKEKIRRQNKKLAALSEIIKKYIHCKTRTKGLSVITIRQRK